MAIFLCFSVVLSSFHNEIQARTDELRKVTADTAAQMLNSSSELEEFEAHIQSLCRQLGDWIVALKVQTSIASQWLQDQARQLAKGQPGKLRYKDKRQVNIRFSGGSRIALSVPYYARRSSPAKRGKGLYPTLYLLGIHDRCSPSLAGEVSLACAALCSLDEARCLLENRGCQLNIKTIRLIAKRYAARARLTQRFGDLDWQNDANSVDNRKVVVATDGGRLRTRRTKKGPKTKKGRHRYHTDWVEPKLMIIYVVNAEGRLDKTYAPFIDGTLQGSDQVFSLLSYYLVMLKITTANTVMFVADGARWIWDRVKKFSNKMGIRVDQFIEVLDFYHVVEHLTEIAKLKSTWSSAQRNRWVTKQRRILRTGNHMRVIDEVQSVCKGARNKLLKRERNYFQRNAHRMNYSRVSKMNLPIGSGAIESAVRRVVNMRLKGPGIFWQEESAEEFIMLRSYYKSGRWGMLRKMACTPTPVCA